MRLRYVCTVGSCTAGSRGLEFRRAGRLHHQQRDGRRRHGTDKRLGHRGNRRDRLHRPTGAAAPPGRPGQPERTHAPRRLRRSCSARTSRPTSTYDGPVYVQEADGTIVPYVPQTLAAAVSGGTVAGTLSAGLPHLRGARRDRRDRPRHRRRAAAAPLVVQGSSGPPTRSSADPTSTAAAIAPSSPTATTAPAPSPSRCTAARCCGAARLRPVQTGAQSGQGQWMTILTNPGHAYLDIAGLRLDTSSADDPCEPAGAALASAATGESRLRPAPPERALAGGRCSGRRMRRPGDGGCAVTPERQAPFGQGEISRSGACRAARSPGATSRSRTAPARPRGRGRQPPADRSRRRGRAARSGRGD